MTDPPRFDVIIAGAGPAGAATATVLARAGVNVLLVDRAEFPRPKACAEYFSPGVVEVLQRLGAWPAVAALPHARLTGMEITARRSRHLVAYPDCALPRRALAVRRDQLDTTLLDGADRAGARVWSGTRVRRLIKANQQVAGVVVEQGLASRVVRADLVIGADGLRSAIAREVGLTGQARWPARLGLVAHYADVPAPADHGEMHIVAGVYCGLAPLGRGSVNVAMVTAVGTARRLGGAEAAFSWMLGRLPAVAARLRPGRRIGALRGVAPLAHRCRRPYAPGLLLVGDAAGFLDPFTGEGVYRALRGGELAADTALQALEGGDFSAASLAPYAAARRRAFAAKDRLCLLIQGFVACPPLFDYALPRLNCRQESGRLAAALGDYAPAGPVVAPAMLWRLLGP